MKLRNSVVAALAAVVSLAPNMAAAGDKGVVAPPFDSTYTQVSGDADRCEADVGGHFVAVVSALDPLASEYCEAGGVIEVRVPQPGATITVNWHINDAFGADTKTDVNSMCNRNPWCVRPGANICLTVAALDNDEWWWWCRNLPGATSNVDLTDTVELAGRGRYVIRPHVIAHVIPRELREARIDAVVTSISIENP